MLADPALLAEPDRAAFLAAAIRRYAYLEWSGVTVVAATGIQHRCVLQRVGRARSVLAQVDPLRVRTVGGDAELDTEETTAGRRGHVHVDDAVAHFEAAEDRCSAVEEKARAALELRHPGLASSCHRGESTGTETGVA